MKYLNDISYKDCVGKVCKDMGKLEGYELDNEIAKKAVRRFLERWRKADSAAHYSDDAMSSNGFASSAFAIANRLRADILPGSDFPVSTACIWVTDTPDRADNWWSVRRLALRCSRIFILPPSRIQFLKRNVLSKRYIIPFHFCSKREVVKRFFTRN